MGAESGLGPLAGILIAEFNTAGLNVRFTPESGHSAMQQPSAALVPYLLYRPSLLVAFENQ